MSDKKKKGDEIKVRKPVPKKPNQIIKSKKDKEKEKRVKHRDLIKEIEETED